ncbi:hypothetical protein AC1031_007623 [Aphanomyces cochlioides]|nr:hypothetical protein AC1031_007623 [Aphanomyces cochlioides]
MSTTKKMPTDFAGLLHYQHSTYNEFHKNPANVRLHLWAVPLFQLGNIAIVLGPLLLLVPVSAPVAIGVTVGGIVMSAISLAAQSRGHSTEVNPPEPFESRLNFVQRIFGEQWINFPRFVLSGGWRIAFEKALTKQS